MSWLVRSDFADDGEFEAAVIEACGDASGRTYDDIDEESAYFEIWSDPHNEGLSPRRARAALVAWLNTSGRSECVPGVGPVVFVADAVTLEPGSIHPFLVVNEDGRSFRVAARDAWSPDCLINDGLREFDEFVEQVGDDGLYWEDLPPDRA